MSNIAIKARTYFFSSVVLFSAVLMPSITVGIVSLQVILNYLMKCVVCEEVCGLLSWRLGHQILSLCYKLMSNYDTVEFFYGKSQSDCFFFM
jgi:hypothetical protein